MMKLISREEVFSRSRLADHCISNIQKRIDNIYIPDNENLEIHYEILDPSIAAELNNTNEEGFPYCPDEEGSLLKDLHDHKKPVHDGKELTDDFGILGYSKKNKADYVANCLKALIRFFEIMHIKQLYLMGELKYDWLRFPFGSQEKLAALKHMINAPSYREAFEIDIEDLDFIFPLFHYSDLHCMPLVFFFSANDQVPIYMLICDDGNFHTDFHSGDREKIFYAASAVGLVMGGLEVCSNRY